MALFTLRRHGELGNRHVARVELRDKRLIAPPLPEASQPSKTTHTGGPSSPPPSWSPTCRRNSRSRLWAALSLRLPPFWRASRTGRHRPGWPSPGSSQTAADERRARSNHRVHRRAGPWVPARSGPAVRHRRLCRAARRARHGLAAMLATQRGSRIRRQDAVITKLSWSRRRARPAPRLPLRPSRGRKQQSKRLPDRRLSSLRWIAGPLTRGGQGLAALW